MPMTAAQEEAFIRMGTEWLESHGLQYDFEIKRIPKHRRPKNPNEPKTRKRRRRKAKPKAEPKTQRRQRNNTQTEEEKREQRRQYQREYYQRKKRERETARKERAQPRTDDHNPATLNGAMRVFGLSGRVDRGIVKRRYRQLAMQHHPDTGGDAMQMAKINVAYETLSRHYR